MKNIERNDPCPCGSGKKYKQCCLKRDEALASNNRAVATLIAKTLAEAIAAHQAGNLRQAETTYQKILQIDPNHPDALHLLGVIAHQEDRSKEAVDLIRKAISVKSTEPMYYSNLGSALQSQGSLDAAAECYRHALALKPDYADACYNLANVFKDQGKLDEALAFYHKALALNPAFADAHNNLGTIFKEQGKLTEASEQYLKAIALKPALFEAHNNMGTVLREQGKLEEAADCYRRALALNPNFSKAQSNLDLVLKELNLVTATRRYRDELSSQSEVAEIHNKLGLTFKNDRLVVPLRHPIDHAFYPRVPAISLELTNNCNLKCPYCANGTLTRPKTYIKWALLEKIIDECAEMHYDLAWLHGVGEPLLWDRLEEVITLIRRRGAGSGSFGTNGTLLHPERVRRLLDAGLSSIYVSIDTLDPEIYKNTRGGKLEKVLNNIQEMIKIVPSSFQITVALMNHKDHHLTEETIKQFHQIFGYHENVRTNLVENALFPSAPGDYRVAGDHKSQGCNAPVNYLFIALDGRAAICCLDQDVLHALGNISERSISDLWFDPITQTTFRNVALGVGECPDTCTKKCILLPPRQDIHEVSPGLGLAFDDAARFADVLLQNDSEIIANSIFQDMLLRDPTNSTLL